MCSLSRSKFEGRLPEAFCRRGTGAAPASGGLTQPPTPGGTRAASPATTSRPGPTTVKGKSQDAALARRKARGVTLHAQGPAIRARPELRNSGPVWRNPGHAPCGAPSPSMRGTEEERNEGAPLAQSRKQGPVSLGLITWTERQPRRCTALTLQIPLCGGRAIMVFIARQFPPSR